MSILDHLHQAQTDYQEALQLSEHADEELNSTPFNLPWTTSTYYIQMTLYHLRVMIRTLEEAQNPI